VPCLGRAGLPWRHGHLVNLGKCRVGNLAEN